MSTLKTIYLQHLNGSTPNLSLTANGRVGIGNTNPQTILHISDSTGLSSNGASRFNLSKSQKGTIHIKSDSYGSNSTNTLQYGITLEPHASGTQAGMFFSENGSDGTAIGFFTTSSYSSGPSLNMILDPYGRVTKPNQPAFGASRSSSYASGQITPYDVIDYNIGGHFNGSTYRFTAPIAGNYAFFVSTIGGSSQDTYRTYLRKNGNNVKQARGPAISNYTCTYVFAIFPLVANDYVDVYATSDGGHTYNGGNEYDYFYGYLIG